MPGKVSDSGYLPRYFDHNAEVELMESTLVPYGNQLADSEFI